ncbi:MAG: hypothetical protein EON58_02810 [Alphaproteobacteria bacterium]|nr:MAG: hypothetical protein EON58_02810 [Alphaproteobacteria bacterium]
MGSIHKSTASIGFHGRKMPFQPPLIALALLTLGATGPAPSRAQELPAYATSAVTKRIAASRPLYTGWPKDLTPLPEQFIPLRTERKGERVVAISTSNLLASWPGWHRPYWVHISNDGGKHWQGYFAGLAVSDPYIFFSTSQLPMLGVNTLDLEGEMLAPASNDSDGFPISTRTPIMVHIPLEAIMSDRDGDGLTDMLARHLGVDGSPDAPIVLGATPAAPCGPLSDEQRLLAAAIEVADGGAHREWSNPLLIVGDPQRFACIPTEQKVLVYALGSKGAGRLSTMHIPVFTLNAVRDRAEGDGWYAKLIDGTWQVTPPAPPMV